VNKHEAKCTNDKCATLATVLFSTLIENLRICSSAKAGIVFNLFLNFEQNDQMCLEFL